MMAACALRLHHRLNAVADEYGLDLRDEDDQAVARLALADLLARSVPRWALREVAGLPRRVGAYAAAARIAERAVLRRAGAQAEGRAR